MFLKASPLPAQVLAAACLGSLAAVAAALVAQHGFDIRPCPWCVLQRLEFLLIALVAAVGWGLRKQRGLRNISLALVAALSASGLATAVYQNVVASKLASCDMTLADRILQSLDLEARVPSVFMVTANCMDAAAYRLLGLPYEVWSGALFLGLALLAMVALRKR